MPVIYRGLPDCAFILVPPSHTVFFQALIVPVIHRGLRDRTGETKKRAARITGNMASLVNDPRVRDSLRCDSGLVGIRSAVVIDNPI